MTSLVWPSESEPLELAAPGVRPRAGVAGPAALAGEGVLTLELLDPPLTTPSAVAQSQGLALALSGGLPLFRDAGEAAKGEDGGLL